MAKDPSAMTNRMPRRITFAAVLLFSIAGIADLNAATLEAKRGEIIAARLNCINSARNSPDDLDWQEVCSTQNTGNNHARIVDSALDSYQLYQKLDSPEESSRPSAGQKQPARPASRARPTVNDIKRTTEVVIPETEKFMRVEEPPIPDTPAAFKDYAVTKQKTDYDLEVGTEVFGYVYREPGVMSMKGYMNSIYALLTYRAREHETLQALIDDKLKINMAKVYGRFSYGKINYDSFESGTDTGIPNYTFEFRGLVGCDVPVDYIQRVTPYIGLGYRYLLDDSGGRLTSDGYWGYNRESNYWYLPLGVESLTTLDERWSLEMNLEYDFLLFGLQKSHIGDGGIYDEAYDGYPVVENNQPHGSGWRSSLKLIYRQEYLDFIVEPFVRIWSIGESDEKAVTFEDITDVWVEPKNNTAEYGIKFGLRY